ncbi:hypothetical protein H257_02162 [Aphanomyces astaci]|uniref:Uncharacterized protein n=1 Tax=Aphanomyces astaci TaxID=112090 RepID=W4H5K7_APHAT|nr:hypothetical protein H257_02162 [Aphanomyces astaci]ETV87187.1 hypothetical protein H257_02162 [Aphanomyces astaci]|eukprot:XP_009823986.1 hypothetical protein H257_02162 [Aphanomyces astaci]
MMTSLDEYRNSFGMAASAIINLAKLRWSGSGPNRPLHRNMTAAHPAFNTVRAIHRFTGEVVVDVKSSKILSKDPSNTSNPLPEFGDESKIMAGTKKCTPRCLK